MIYLKVVDTVLQSSEVDAPLVEARCGLTIADIPANSVLPSSGLEKRKWSEEQHKDTDLNILVEQVGGKTLCADKKKIPYVKRLLRHQKPLVMRDDVLCRQRQVMARRYFRWYCRQCIMNVHWKVAMMK